MIQVLGAFIIGAGLGATLYCGPVTWAFAYLDMLACLSLVVR